MSLSSNIYGLSPHELGDQLGGSGRGKHVWRALRQARSPLELDDASQPLLLRLRDIDSTLPISLEHVDTATCGTRKLLVRCQDGSGVELVLIPGRGRTTVCVSTQVGCARACTFCVTATMGLVRSLSAAEIVAQVALAMRVAAESQLPPVRNVVYMGMGEPLDNFEAVQQSLKVLTDPWAFSLAPRHITVSTVGPSPRAIRRAAELPGYLAWSVHAANDGLRRQLVPTTRHSMVELRDAFVEVLRQQRRHLFVEMTLIQDVNDDVEHAQALAALLAPFDRRPRVNLLPMNAGRAGLQASTGERVQAFARELVARGYRTMVRTPRGSEAAAACGQLAVRG